MVDCWIKQAQGFNPGDNQVSTNVVNLCYEHNVTEVT